MTVLALDGPIGKATLCHVFELWVESQSSFFLILSLHASYFNGNHFIFFIQVAENLAQLMYSVMMTGYMFRNAQYRLELQESLEQVALPDVQDKKVHHFSSLSFWIM